MTLPTINTSHATSHDRWPASPLQAAGRAFDLLTAPPARLAFDGTGFAGLPQYPLDLPVLKQVLLSPAVAPAQRDAVWRALVARTREDAAPPRVWTVLAVGLALPGLTRVAGRLARGWPGDAADLDAEVLAGFLLRLTTLDLAGQRVLGRLLDAATRAGRRARASLGDGATVRVDQPWPAPPAQPWAHPDWVLARAVAAGVLDRTEARLIGATRLEDVTLTDAAAALELSVPTALAWRRAGEQRLAAAITCGELDHVRLQAPRSASRSPAAVPARAGRGPLRTGRRTSQHRVAPAVPAP